MPGKHEKGAKSDQKELQNHQNGSRIDPFEGSDSIRNSVGCYVSNSGRENDASETTLGANGGHLEAKDGHLGDNGSTLAGFGDQLSKQEVTPSVDCEEKAVVALQGGPRNEETAENHGETAHDDAESSPKKPANEPKKGKRKPK